MCERDGVTGQGSAPAPAGELRTAIDHARAGDWQAAHVIVQEYEDDPIAGWIHAVVHRMEGDFANASYWYRRSDRPLRKQVTTLAELGEIAEALAAR